MAVTNALSSFIHAFRERLPRKYLWVLPLDVLTVVCACIVFAFWNASNGVSVDQAWAHGLYGIVWLALGILVFVVRPQEFSSLLFNLMGVGLMLQELDLSQAALSHAPFVRFIVPIYIVLNSAVILHFLLVFPKPRWWRWRVIMPFYLAFGIVCVLTEANAFGFTTISSETLTIVRAYLYPAMNLGGMILVFTNYFSSRDPAERRRIRWTFVGGAIAFIWQAATVNVPRLLSLNLNLDPILMQAGLFAAPIGIAIGLVWYNAFEIDRLLSQTLTYGAVLGLLVVIYEAFGYFLSQMIDKTVSAIGSILVTTIIAIGFDPVKERVQEFVEERFGDRGKRMEAEDSIAEIEKLAMEHGGKVEFIPLDGGALEITIRFASGFAGGPQAHEESSVPIANITK